MSSVDETVSQGTCVSPWRVLIAGGSYAGLAAATNLLDLCEARPPRFAFGNDSDSDSRQKIPLQITVVDERDGYYHLIGSPLALAEEQYASKAWVKFSNVAALKYPAIRVVQGNLCEVDCKTRIATIIPQGANQPLQEQYDYLIAASGLRRGWPTVPQSLSRAEYLSEARGHIDSVTTAKEGVVVVGGGAVGIEMAAELKAVQPNQMVTLIHSRDRLLSSEPLPDDFKEKTLSLLRGSGVNVIVSQRVTNITSTGPTSTLTLSDGAQLTTGHVISAISQAVPSTTYLPPETLDPDGYVKISPSLHFPSDIPNYRYHFAVGDIAAWSGIKRCGAAMHMGHFASENIYLHMLHHHNTSPSSSPLSTSPPSAAASETASSNSTSSNTDPKLPFKTLSEHPPMIGLAIGNTAISYSPTEGTKHGRDVLQCMFGDDLGWSICWNYMQLGKSPETVLPKEKVRRLSEEVEGARTVVDVEGQTTPGKE